MSAGAVGVRKRILIIEDEPDIVRGVRDALEFEGFEVLSAGDGRDGTRLAREKSPDCIVLDLMLPDANGYAVCEAIRGHNAVVPIIMLTARSQESDKIRGLEVGADDYVTKPFSVGELIARIKAIFRRLGRQTGVEEVIKIGTAEVNVRQHTVTRGRKTEPLTFYEVELVKLLHERAEQPVSRDELLEKIWGIQPHPANRTVDNFIVKLRRKIEDDQKRPRHIMTVYGYGYKLVP
ncbi:MAG: response regulator transcription factor [Myxococcales bacterium]|nr:response regulator transcription factor [Myxococcales bacterium]